MTWPLPQNSAHQNSQCQWSGYHPPKGALQASGDILFVRVHNPGRRDGDADHPDMGRQYSKRMTIVEDVQARDQLSYQSIDIFKKLEDHWEGT